MKERYNDVAVSSLKSPNTTHLSFTGAKGKNDLTARCHFCARIETQRGAGTSSVALAPIDSYHVKFADSSFLEFSNVIV